MNGKTPAAQLIDWPKLFYGLEERGFHLTDEEKEKLKKITEQQLSMHNSNDFFASATGTTQNILYVIFAALQNIFKGDIKFDDLAGSSENMFGKVNEQRKDANNNWTTMWIAQRLIHEGGNLAAASEAITGQKPINPGSFSGPAMDVPGNLSGQLSANVNLPPGTSSTLSRNS